MMRNSVVRLTVALVIVTLTLASSVFVAVREGQVAVVTRLGAPRAVWRDAGLHAKWPWPIEHVWVMDARHRLFNSRFAETLTRDKKNIVLRTFVVWSVGEPLTFLQAVGDLATAEDRLDGLVTNAKNAVLGRYELAALASTDPGRLKIPEIETDILTDVRATAHERFGVAVHQIGLKQLGLPPENVPFVFDQMRTERRQFAARYRAEGEREAAAIRSQTDLDAARVRAEGTQKAAEIRARAEAQAARIYAEAQRRDPELYRFLRSLESLQALLGKRTTVILRTDAAPFTLLNTPGPAEGGGAASGRVAK
ncbi:MAG TPA: protease modulator HflC [Methylomirabilota bacterium]|jgi:membrane protease subunit HflC|nr:protease modulator HflC [Methylomirabilota bacterium]